MPPETFVAKKKAEDTTPAAHLQVNLKMRGSLKRRFIAIADTLGIDLANLARQMIAENMTTFEERAAKVRPARPAPDEGQ